MPHRLEHGQPSASVVIVLYVGHDWKNTTTKREHSKPTLFRISRNKISLFSKRTTHLWLIIGFNKFKCPGLFLSIYFLRDITSMSHGSIGIVRKIEFEIRPD